MSQQFQQIGHESDDLAAVVDQKQGWQGQTAKPPIEEIVGDFDFSFRDRRANRQALGFGGQHGETGIPNMAGYTQPENAASIQPEPWDPYNPKPGRP